ncbi:LuxR C-terminal-related transcriptional regulator [Paenibacillus macerans]|uniref:LuxR C-terminal-related transcriptional regulator n=1 Tax=Paenibacillus macerans TaxID=44252 RepID=UPI003D310495
MSMQMYEWMDSARPPRLLGREWELETFSVYLSHYGRMERIISIYGAAGVGKSSLAEEFQRQAARQGVTAIALDAARFKATPAEFSQQILHQLGLLGTLPSFTDPDFLIRAAVEAVNKRAEFGPTFFFLDTYELLEPLDDWLREFFFAQIKDSCVSVISGRNPLSKLWTDSLFWKRAIYRMPLTNLDYTSVVAYLRGCGIADPEQIVRIWKQTDGLPFTLASMYGEPSGGDLPSAGLGEMPGRELRSASSFIGLPSERMPKSKPEEAIYARTDLTHREKEVAALAAEGLTNRDIASRLFLSEVTIKKHMRSIFQKVGASNRTQLLKLLMD